ncbi:MAG: hypothetical protein ACEPOZ_11690 [Marinifilaceae bacterium]
MKNILGTLICLSLCTTAIGQVNFEGPNDIEGQRLRDINAFTSDVRVSKLEQLDYLSEKFDGSPFLCKEWNEGKVIFEDGQSIKYQMHYNVYAQEFWIKKDKSKIKKLKIVKNIDKIELQDKQFQFVIHKLNQETKSSIMELLVDKKHRLYKQHNCKFLNGDKNVNSYSGPQKSKFSQNQKYFYSNGDEILPLPTKKKAFFKCFGDDSTKIAAFCKKNKLKTNKNTDLVKIFEFYNQ